MQTTASPSVSSWVEDGVGHVRLDQPPHNFISHQIVADLADAFEALDMDTACRATVLSAAGKSFCAGANLSLNDPTGSSSASSPLRHPHIYREAERLMHLRKPMVAAVQGAAVGAGVGLALTADFRVAAPRASFWLNFSRLGIHAGFGITATLPALIGVQKASLLLQTGRRIDARHALSLGLIDAVSEDDDVRSCAVALAMELAAAAPLAVASMRDTLRRDLRTRFRDAVEREMSEQNWQVGTADFTEGVAAITERRAAEFTAR